MTLVRARDHGGRAPRLPGCRRQGLGQLPVIMTVHLDDRPAEGPELFWERLQVTGVRDRGTLLQAIAVDDEDEPVESAVRGDHHRLPIGPFLEFPVPHDDEGAPG